ncbi:MAG: N-acetyl-gamma-glutamyl-phosphate reductase [Candidatus Altiarchaeota archaeon]
MKAIVVGGSGYSGGELLRILVAHPKVEKVETTSRTYAGKEVSDLHTNLRGLYNGKFNEYDAGKVDADVAFLAVPHGEGMEHAPKLLERGIKVVDLSADYRISDVKVYERYYQKHKNPELLKKAAYGLPELFRNEIKGASLVANPGCYTTAAILSLAPLKKFKEKVDLKKVVVDAKSGTSGAGAKPTEFIHHSEVFDNVKAYKVTGHRHQPEIEHILDRLMPGISVSFTPTLVPVVRGILSNAHVFGELDGDELKKQYADFYAKEKFVRIVENAHMKNVAYSNYCDIAVHYDSEKRRAVLISAIDNLVKGAAGQAVQNMNIIMGYKESEGLETVPYHP